MASTLFPDNAGPTYGAPACRPEELAAYQRFYQLLIEGNELTSLVSPKSLATAWGTHFADSVFLCDFGAQHRGTLPVFDIGTGAGFPGLVHAIRFPAIPITLYERNLKKRTFLTTVCTELQLANVTIAEDFRKPAVRGLYFARAVAPRDELLPVAHKAMAPLSLLVTALGGKHPTPEEHPSWQRLDHIRYTLPQEQGDRQAELLRRR